ncbi:hypothetical protein JXA47_00510 [Candidatus Sumerlaeota bacterium]|nr:hypothetical protein [Candidatus Sumerlaeota bacterium]
MSIGGIGQTSILHASLARTHRAESTDELPPADSDEELERPEEEDEDMGRAKGVLRNLLEGHFKGVADLRLRINFHAELTAIQDQAVREVTEEKIAEIQGTVDGAVDSLLASEDVTEDQANRIAEIHENFTAELQGQVAAPPDPQSADTPSPVDALEISLHDFLTALTAALTPVPEEPLGDVVSASLDALDEAEAGTSPPEGAVESPAIPASLQEILTGLGEALESALAELREEIESARALPELSEPHGNGRAYAKFLAIYSEMTGAAETPESAEGEGLAATA